MGSHLHKAGISVESVLKVVYQPQVVHVVVCSVFRYHTRKLEKVAC